jgi:heat shock protein HslJ
VLPCADCEGIETTLELGQDQRYVLRKRYLGRSEDVLEQSGAFSWDRAGGTITLAGVVGEPSRYRVGESTLARLDAAGQPVEGPAAERSLLRKLPADPAAPPAEGREPPEALFAPGGWRLAELRGRPVAATPGRRVPTVTFVREGSAVGGFAGCNRFSGRFEHAAGRRLRLSPLAVTRMACPDMALEDAFLRALAEVEAYRLDGAALELRRAGEAPLARLAPEAPPSR